MWSFYIFPLNPYYSLRNGNECVLSYVWLFVTPWTVVCQAPLSMGLSWQEYWSGLPSPPSGISLTQGLNLCLLWLLHCKASSLPLGHLGNPSQSHSLVETEVQTGSIICSATHNFKWEGFNLFSVCENVIFQSLLILNIVFIHRRST